MAKPRKKSGQGRSATEASDSRLAASPQSAGDVAATNVDRKRIAQRAYELYLARGGKHGQDMEDWFRAERELVASSPRTGEGR